MIPTFLPIVDSCFFPEGKLKKLASPLAEKYKTAAPFPHIIIDNFLPSDVVNRVENEFPKIINREEKRSQEIYKGYILPDQIPSTFVRTLFYSFNSQPFLEFLEELTGISGLLPDPYFLGGGLHETIRNGKLGIHADFNIHQKLRAQRRINVLVYLNKNWQKEYGGNLELWDRKMVSRQASIEPIFNRCVIFSTDSSSFHGHPDPLQCPENMSRKSIALYYYTASDSIFSEHRLHTTIFKARPDSSDEFDYFIRAKYFIRDCIPPILTRSLLKLFRS